MWLGLFRFVCADHLAHLSAASSSADSGEVLGMQGDSTFVGFPSGKLPAPSASGYSVEFFGFPMAFLAFFGTRGMRGYLAVPMNSLEFLRLPRLEGVLISL